MNPSCTRTDRGRFTGTLGAITTIALVVAACGSTSPSGTTAFSTLAPQTASAAASPAGAASATSETTAPSSTASASTAPVASPSTGTADRNPTRLEPGAAYEPAIDPAAYVQDIDNPFWPLKPGTRWTFKSA